MQGPTAGPAVIDMSHLLSRGDDNFHGGNNNPINNNPTNPTNNNPNNRNPINPVGGTVNTVGGTFTSGGMVTGGTFTNPINNFNTGGYMPVNNHQHRQQSSAGYEAATAAA